MSVPCVSFRSQKLRKLRGPSESVDIYIYIFSFVTICEDLLSCLAKVYLISLENHPHKIISA